MRTFTLSISNMEKGADEERINEVLHDVWGVRNVKMNPEKRKAVVSFDEKAASLQDFTQAIIDSGFDVTTEDELTP